jgi:hypothetical protein
VPSTCSNLDIEVGLRKFFEIFLEESGVELRIKVDEELCYLKDEEWISSVGQGAKLTMYVYNE